MWLDTRLNYVAPAKGRRRKLLVKIWCRILKLGIEKVGR